MLDLLAAIVSADPPSLLGWLVLAFAAGMYPVGIMLGSSCSPCCNANPCTQCTEGELPETLTVTFSGLADQTPGPDLCLLTFSAPYGSGAAGKVTAPGGDPATDKGPITAVSVTNGGSGYAKFGRVAPTITASGGSGTGATFTVQTSKTTAANGIPSWSVTGVTFTGTASGYVDGDQITFSVAEGDTAEQGAAATIHTIITAPTVTAKASGGTGATLGVTIAANGTTPQTWSVTAISVTSGGTGYPATGYVTFNVASGDTEEEPAHAIFYCGRVVPTVTASASGFGSGASLSASLASTTGYDGRAYWYVDGVTISNGGTGYSELDQIAFTVTDGNGYGAYADVSSVDEDGAITGVTVYWGGEYFKSNGVIQSVELDYDWWSPGGVYYRDAGEIASISVEAGGKYYREDASLSPYVATVTVGVAQAAPSNGTGAALTATVEDDTGSPDFGKIASVAIDGGGDGYLARELFDTCLSRFDGRSIVLKRNPGNLSPTLPMAPANMPCSYGFKCDFDRECSLEAEWAYVAYRGPNIPPRVNFGLSRPGDNTVREDGQLIYFPDAAGLMTASENVTDCSEFDVTATGGLGVPEGATAHITAGGEYEEPETCRKIVVEDYEWMQYEIEWNGFSWTASPGDAGIFPSCGKPRGSFDRADTTVGGCGLNAGFGWEVASTCASTEWLNRTSYIYGGMQIGQQGCEWGWGYPVIAYAVFSDQLGFWPWTSFRYCHYSYQIVGYDLDDEGFPVGNLEIKPLGLLNGVHNPNFFGVGPCEDPGVPSISVSRLP